VAAHCAPRRALLDGGLTELHGTRPSANLLVELPILARRIAEGTGTARDYEVLVSYYGLKGRPRQVLSQIGESFGLTRERVRQLRERLRTSLRTALAGEWTDPRVTVPAVLVTECREIKLSLALGPGLRNQDEMAEWFATRYGKLEAQEMAAIPLLLLLVGCHQYGSHPLGAPEIGVFWSTRGAIDMQRTRAVVGAIQDLPLDAADGVTWFQLSIRAMRAVGGYVSEAETREVGRLIPRLEPIGSQRVRCRMDHLRSYAARAYRVLSQAGKPLHFREIAKRVRDEHRRLGHPNYKVNVDLRGISPYLSLSSRFKPVGRSGQWMLTEWTHVRGDTVSDLLKELLETLGRPVTHDEAWAFIAPIRPDVQRAALIAATHVHEHRFVRMTKKRVGLQSWKIAPEEVRGYSHRKPRPRRAQPSPIRNRLIKNIRNYLRNRPGYQAPLRELMRDLGRPEAGPTDPYVYRVVTLMTDIRKFDVDGIRHVELTTDDP